MRPAIYGLLLLLPACGAASADQNDIALNLSPAPYDNFIYEAPPSEAVLSDMVAPANDNPPDPASIGDNPVVIAGEVYRACVARLVDALWRTRGEPYEIVARARSRCGRHRAAYLTAALAAARSLGDANPNPRAEGLVQSDDDRLHFELGRLIEEWRYPGSE